MYIAKSFEKTNESEVFSFIRENAFGQLTSNHESRLFSTHVPFLIGNDNQTLLCHLAKQNQQLDDIENQEVMITFNGPHDYISPSWYEKEGGVPTWNYQAVHVYGHAQIITNNQDLIDIVEKLTTVYESKEGSPWKMKYDEKLLHAIVGVEIKITEVQCKFKLSQNRSKADRKNIVEALMLKGSIELANAMKESA